MHLKAAIVFSDSDCCEYSNSRIVFYLRQLIHLIHSITMRPNFEAISRRYQELQAAEDSKDKIIEVS